MHIFKAQKSKIKKKSWKNQMGKHLIHRKAIIKLHHMIFLQKLHKQKRSKVEYLEMKGRINLEFCTM